MKKGWFLKFNMGESIFDEEDDDEQLPVADSHTNASDVLWTNPMTVYFRNRTLFYIHPVSMEDCITIINKLKEKNTIVIDFYHLSQVDYFLWQRTVDFLYGAIYALDAEAVRHDKYKTLLIPDGYTFNEDEITRIIAQDRIDIKED